MKVQIYGLVDPRDEKIKYIGKANNSYNRLKGHIYECKKENKTNNKKVNWIKTLVKLGLKPELEILDEVEESNWQFWEQWWIELFKSWNFDLKNSTKGGDGAHDVSKRKKVSEETKKKRSIGLKRSYNNRDGYWKGKFRSKEFKEHMSLIGTGRKMSLESRKKMSESNLGRKMSLESKKKMSESHKGLKPWNAGINEKIVQCPYCFKEGGNRVMKRHHFENCLNKSLERNLKQQTKLQNAKCEIKICPHCNKIGSGANMTRYHFNNCSVFTGIKRIQIGGRKSFKHVTTS